MGLVHTAAILSPFWLQTLAGNSRHLDTFLVPNASWTRSPLAESEELSEEFRIQFLHPASVEKQDGR